MGQCKKMKELQKKIERVAKQTRKENFNTRCCGRSPQTDILIRTGSVAGELVRNIKRNITIQNDLSVGVAGYLLGGGVNWLGTYNK